MKYFYQRLRYCVDRVSFESKVVSPSRCYFIFSWNAHDGCLLAGHLCRFVFNYVLQILEYEMESEIHRAYRLTHDGFMNNVFDVCASRN